MSHCSAVSAGDIQAVNLFCNGGLENVCNIKFCLTALHPSFERGPLSIRKIKFVSHTRANGICQQGKRGSMYTLTLTVFPYRVVIREPDLIFISQKIRCCLGVCRISCPIRLIEVQI